MNGTGMLRFNYVLELSCDGHMGYCNETFQFIALKNLCQLANYEAAVIESYELGWTNSGKNSHKCPKCSKAERQKFIAEKERQKFLGLKVLSSHYN